MKAISSQSKSLVYDILDLLTAGRGIQRTVCGESIRFPVRWCRYYQADYEPITFNFLRTHCRKGDDVLDIGAHIGLFSVLIARLVGPAGRVFSFEPTPVTREVLKKTVEINGFGKIVDVRSEAVSKASGTATFFDTGDLGSNANSLVKTERHSGGFSVKTVSVDDFVSRHNLRVSCIKIDVEGAESDVLLGASQTIIRQRPAVSLALHPNAVRQFGGTLDGIWEFLADSRMLVTNLSRQVDKAWFCAQEDLFDVQCLPDREGTEG